MPQLVYQKTYAAIKQIGNKMEALYKISNNVTVKVEAENTIGLVEELTRVRESIGPEACGKCKGTNTYPNARVVGDNTYYELRCSCGAVLQLGVNKADKNLYKKRLKTDSKGKAIKDESDKAVYLPNKGWLKWNPETKEME